MELVREQKVRCSNLEANVRYPKEYKLFQEVQTVLPEEWTLFLKDLEPFLKVRTVFRKEWTIFLRKCMKKKTPNIIFDLTYLSVTTLAKARLAPAKTQVKIALE